MSNATEVNSTTVTQTTTTSTSLSTTISTTPDAASKIYEIGIIGGPTLCAACALVIIVLVCVCWRRRRRSRKQPPPLLPNPFARLPAEYQEPPISEAQDSPDDAPVSDYRRKKTSVISQQRRVSDFSRNRSESFASSVSQTWRVQEPIIHSAETSHEDNRVSYILMMEPSRPISMSPPSPEPAPEIQLQPRERRPSPAACRHPDGYINVTRQNVNVSPNVIRQKAHLTPDVTHTFHLSPKDSGGQSTTAPTDDELSQNEDNNENYTNVEFIHKLADDEDNNENYTNVEFIHKLAHDGVEKPEHLSLSSADLSNAHPPDSSFPDLQIGESDDFCGNRFTAVSDNETSQCDSSSSSDIYVQESPRDTQTSYVNVDEFKKPIPLDQPANENLHEPVSSSETISHISSSAPTSSDRLKPPITMPKPKPGKKTTATSSPISGDSNDSMCVKQSQNPAGINKPAAVTPAVKPGFTNAHVDDENTISDTISLHAASTNQLATRLAPGKNNIIGNENTYNNGVVERSPSSNTPEDGDSVYQNSSQLSLFDRKLSNASISQTCVTNLQRHADNPQEHAGNTQGHTGNTQEHAGNTQEHAGNTQGHAGNTQEHAGNTQGHAGNTQGHAGNTQRQATTKVQQDFNGKTSIDTTKTVSARQSVFPPAPSRPYLQNIKFGSSPNVSTSVSNLKEMRSKLKKVQ